MENKEDYIKAGKIAAQVREYARRLLKPGQSLLEATELIENKILELGGGIAFPTDLSINDIAAHYSAFYQDKTIFKDSDLVKIDLGVHINGAIADTACTVSLNNTNRELIEASEKALSEALKLVRPGTVVSEIGERINEVINGYGFSSIKNLSGHGLDLFSVHTKPTIPNFNNGDQTKLKEGQVIAIEPFATTGVGLITEGKPAEIYSLVNLKPTRNQAARRLLNFVQQEYKTLPFAKRWVLKRFPNFQTQVALVTLQREGVLQQYNQLPEKSKAIVSQAEHSVIVEEKPIIITL